MTYAPERMPLTLRTALDFVYPPLCLGCGDYLAVPGPICECCRGKMDREVVPVCVLCLQPLMPDLSCELCKSQGLPLLASGPYTFPVDQIIGQLKFYGIRKAATLLGGNLARQYGSEIKKLGANVLLPIPLHSARLYSRGYNQAELIARAISEQVGIEVRTDLLRRRGWRRPQTRVAFNKRAGNVRAVFVSERDEPPLRIAIVDDVVTTGSTVIQARAALEEAGHQVVGILAVAGGG